MLADRYGRNEAGRSQRFLERNEQIGHTRKTVVHTRHTHSIEYNLYPQNFTLLSSKVRVVHVFLEPFVLPELLDGLVFVGPNRGDGLADLVTDFVELPIL